MDVGVEINQYTVIEHIGRGGMADVWSARDQRLNRMVAIKTVAHGLSEDVDPVGMFMTEAQTIARMEHPHILPIYDFGEFEGQLYIVMRYVSGGSLDELLRHGPLSLEDALRMAQAIALALDHAHSNKVVHLDLKPPNVLLDSHQSPYLADFGLATRLNVEGKAMNPGSGTLLYMAPEQVTAEMIDHRADIYSFCIVLFHMLTGQLPFEGGTPLALKQLQYHQDIPELEALNPSLSPIITDILRKGTAIKPEHRPDTIMSIIEEIREVMREDVRISTGEWENPYGTYDPLSVEGEDADGDLFGQILEANDIYNRARYEWSNGQGRFVLGVTDFMMMNGYYMDAEKHGLDLDLEGQHVLLRGALEYNHEVEFWWEQLTDDDRRWVCLHAIRSGSAPARIRAFYRLETLPDSDNRQIPTLVAQALQIEVNKEARIAALQVLGTRARLQKPEKTYDIKTQYRGQMLTTLTRFGIQVNTPNVWQETIFSQEIDELIAKTALDNGMPEVAEFAARIVGRMRSVTAVKYIVDEQAKGRRGALRALAFIRDEAPSLPDVVGVGGRFYAWMTNSYIRLTRNPMRIVWRFIFAFIAGALAMGYHVNRSLIFTGSFLQRRWASTISIGLVFGILVGVTVIFSGEFTARLRKFWHGWERAIFGLITGVFFGTIAWLSWQWFFLETTPSNDLIIFGGVGLSLGFVLTALFNLRSWIAIPLTALLVYTPIYITFNVGWKFDEIGMFTYGFDGFWFFTETMPWYVVLLLGGLGLGASLFAVRRFRLSNLVAVPLVILTILVPILIGYFVTSDTNDLMRYQFSESLVYYFDTRPFDLDGDGLNDPLGEEPIYTIMIPFAILIAVGGHMLLLTDDVRQVINRMRDQRYQADDALKRQTSTQHTIDGEGQAQSPILMPERPQRAESLAPIEADTMASVQDDLYDLETRMDVNAPEAIPTELDVNMGNLVSKSDEQSSEEHEVITPPQNVATELDVNLGKLASNPDEDMPQQQESQIKRVNFGTGIKVSNPAPDEDDSDEDTPQSNMVDGDENDG